MIRKHKDSLGERTTCTCDRCGRDIILERDCEEWQERFAIRFRGGYGSVFGDGKLVKADFCQQCIYQVLGSYCRIICDDPFSAGDSADREPQRIYQPNQLNRIALTEDFADDATDELSAIRRSRC